MISELRYDQPTIDQAAAALRSIENRSAAEQVLLDVLENGAEEVVSTTNQSKDHRDAARHIQTELADEFLAQRAIMTMGEGR